MRFHHILHKNSIDHLLRTSITRLFSAPNFFFKEMENIFVMFLCFAGYLLVEFFVLLTKILPKNIDFYR